MKKVAKDIRTLVVVFVLVFVALSVAAVNAIPKDTASSSSVRSPAHGGNQVGETRTTHFHFQAPVLRLGTNSDTHTSFLVVTNQAAIVDGWVKGAAVSLTIKPFAIDVLSAGQTKVYLSALMIDGRVKTINCTVVVEGGGINEKDKGDEKETQLAGQLIYEFESEDSIEFSLLFDNKKETMFRLSAVALEGDVAVGVIASTVRIKYFSENTCFKIKVVATVNSVVVAVLEVENRL